ncbi:MAG: hypothetical protein OEL80_02185 [Desulfuromonadales bacterium]|jgi:hypothetical protein|nr:hypothetical protein [Desulfuromonadales bacterium]
MKRGLIFVLLAAVALFCMGMGGLGGQPEGTVPETDVRIQADIKDHHGIVTSLNQFSMDGKTYLDAWRGQGKLTIPFQHIDTVTFGELKGDEVKVDAKLKSGAVMTLTIRSRAQFYGSTGFGAFQIQSRDVALIDFP